MNHLRWIFITAGILCFALDAAAFKPAPQNFRQEVSLKFGTEKGLPSGAVQLVDISPAGKSLVFVEGNWYEMREEEWKPVDKLKAQPEQEFLLEDGAGEVVRVPAPWKEVKQVFRGKSRVWVATEKDPYLVMNGKAQTMGWPSRMRVNQIAAGRDEKLWVASSDGLFRQHEKGWEPLRITDAKGRAWAVGDVPGVAVDAKDQLWFCTKAGVGCRTEKGWRFFEGKDGLPFNEFTGITAGKRGELWFGTTIGAVRFDGENWHYRQGKRWLPHDEVRGIAIDGNGDAWFATAGGVGAIQWKEMKLAAKAEVYEEEIEKYIKRTPFGYVAEAPLRRAGDKSSAGRSDSDNDGLWTAMYGAGECFAYAATKDAKARERAKQAFEALRFLQKVVEGGSHQPPKGYIARTILPTDGPNPNEGRLEQDRQAQKRDKLWKVYEPRWPKSADGKWYWKSDTSSDELDGHFFFYPLYYEFCADSEEEKERVRDVVRGVADHLVEHGFVLIDHDGKPTRWAIFGPQFLNHDPNWWPERGLNSLSILSYLEVAAYITGDQKYSEAARELVGKHGYAQNVMYPKVQHGPGSGNQSDDEMAFMCYYNLLRYSKNELLKEQVRYSFFRYWANEAPEMNPFFNFAYAAHNLNASVNNVWGSFPIKPWAGWFEDSMATLYGFPLDRLNWGHRNSHRLDVELLGLQNSVDLYEARRRGRGLRVNGKVLPVENRHFNHWNTDPWQMDYGGEGNELASGTVFLLPYYMGLYHGFIEK